jgi:hypothetical protein
VEKANENTMYLKCTEHHCKSQMIVKTESITKGLSDHSHVADVSKRHAKTVVANGATHLRPNPFILAHLRPKS